MDSDSDKEKSPRRLESLAAEESPTRRAESQSHRKTLEKLQKLRIRASQSRHSVSTVSNESRGSHGARRWRERPMAVVKTRTKKADSQPLGRKKNIDLAMRPRKNDQNESVDADTGRVVISLLDSDEDPDTKVDKMDVDPKASKSKGVNVSQPEKKKQVSYNRSAIYLGGRSKRKRNRNTASSSKKRPDGRDFVDLDADESRQQSRGGSRGASLSPNPNDLKPECAGEPPAWALCKSELVYTMPWFNSPMSSTYHTMDYGVHGHIMDRDSGCRYMDEEIIIMSLTGGYKKTSEWKWVLKSSQTYKNNIFARAFLESHDKQRPMAVVIGDKCDMISTKMPHRLNVMDHFMVTDIWQDNVDGLLRFSVRLQKLDLMKKSWWAEKGTPEPPTREARQFEARGKFKKCNGIEQDGEFCGGVFWQVYECGWMCLNPVCQNFWLVNGVKAAPADELQFHKGYLCFRTGFDVEASLKKIRYPLIPQVDLDKEDSHTRRDGVLCPKCNRCVPRTYLGYWKCDLHWCTTGRVDEPREHEKCDWEYKLKQKVCGLNEAQMLEVNDAFRNARRTQQPSFDGYVRVKHPLFNYDQYLGTITHFTSNQRINAKPNGPDDLFKLLQASSSGIGFRRHRGSCPTVPGTLSNNFLQNLGLPYNFFVPNMTRAFNEISKEHPDLMHAYARLDWAFRQAAEADGTEYHRPNELLMIGYLQGQKINWHDDGDGKLGPQIATLCLGAKARMMIRIKPDYHYGLNYAGKPLKEEVILKGCENEELRTDLRNQFLAGKINQEEYDKLRKEHLRRPFKSSADVRLELILHHGDIVVMNGINVQKYYEHTVESIDDMRFAITARHLLEDDKSVKYQMNKWKVKVDVGHYMIKDHEVYHGN